MTRQIFHDMDFDIPSYRSTIEHAMRTASRPSTPTQFRQARNRHAGNKQTQGIQRDFVDFGQLCEMKRSVDPVRNKETRSHGFQPMEEIVAFESMLADIGSMVMDGDGFKPYESHFGGILSRAKDGGGSMVCTKAGKGVRIMSMVDAKALLIAVNTGSASPQESGLSKPLFNLMLTVDFQEDSRRLQAAQIQAAPDSRANDRMAAQLLAIMHSPRVIDHDVSTFYQRLSDSSPHGRGFLERGQHK